jgi:hypothetical protein
MRSGGIEHLAHSARNQPILEWLAAGVAAAGHDWFGEHLAQILKEQLWRQNRNNLSARSSPYGTDKRESVWLSMRNRQRQLN